MARSKVSGMSIEDIMDLDSNLITKMDFKELKKYTSRLVSAANKRLKRFEQRNEKSSAVRSAERTGLLQNNRFSVKNITNKKEARKYYNAVRRFLRNKTSTKKGYDDEVSKFRKAFGFDLKNVNRGKNKERLNVVERVRTRLHELFPEYQGDESLWQYKYNEITKDIRDYTKGGKWDEDEVVERIVENVRRTIENSSQNYQDDWDEFMEIAADADEDFPELFG